jgi:formamidopyrimidine-DNA glycosylase
MPELPEVEITRRSIAKVLVGRRIEKLSTTGPSYFFLTPPAVLKRALRGRSVVTLSRHGKYLLAALDDERRLLLHLGMTGQLFSDRALSPRLLSATARAALTPESQRRFQPDAHTHVTFWFDDGGPKVFFRDVRKFGKVKLLDPGQGDRRLDKLGTDALQAEAQRLLEKAQRRRVPTKTLLLDQGVLAGVGNIYADEALFLAGIRPRRRAARLTLADCAALSTHIKAVLRRSIATGGSSISDFVNADGSDGHYQDERFVYARRGEPCRRCQTPIRRTRIGQRSAHYCPSCQK